MMQGLCAAGVRRVRITGGEPLVARRVVETVSYLASLRFDDLAMTTNATRLAVFAEPLRRAGLHRITVSVDSLVPERFARITRGGDLDEVIRGVDAAVRAGFRELKLNCVVLRGENDDELESIARWAWDRGITPRFIELMPIAEGARLVGRHLVTAAEMRERLESLLEPDDAAPDVDRGPAKYVRARHDARRRIGFITGTSDTFCGSCDRLRVASDGVLRPCLASEVGVSARAEARAGDLVGIAAAIEKAWAQKPDGNVWKGCTEESASRASMRAIGG